MQLTRRKFRDAATKAVTRPRARARLAVLVVRRQFSDCGADASLSGPSCTRPAARGLRAIISALLASTFFSSGRRRAIAPRPSARTGSTAASPSAEASAPRDRPRSRTPCGAATPDQLRPDRVEVARRRLRARAPRRFCRRTQQDRGSIVPIGAVECSPSVESKRIPGMSMPAASPMNTGLNHG